MAQDKKPVWADQEAHGILKRWASSQKRHMVDVASELLLEKLPLLEGDAAASAGQATAASKAEEIDEAPSPPTPSKPAGKEAKPQPAEAAAAAEPEDVAEVAEVAASAETADSPSHTEVRRVDKPSSGVRPMTDSDTTFLGGVWLV